MKKIILLIIIIIIPIKIIIAQDKIYENDDGKTVMLNNNEIYEIFSAGTSSDCVYYEYPTKSNGSVYCCLCGLNSAHLYCKEKGYQEGSVVDNGKADAKSYGCPCIAMNDGYKWEFDNRTGGPSRVVKIKCCGATSSSISNSDISASDNSKSIPGRTPYPNSEYNEWIEYFKQDGWDWFDNIETPGLSGSESYITDPAYMYYFIIATSRHLYDCVTNISTLTVMSTYENGTTTLNHSDYLTGKVASYLVNEDSQKSILFKYKVEVENTSCKNTNDPFMGILVFRKLYRD
jgi:hypothetical protein